jgi:hypothetical protein
MTFRGLFTLVAVAGALILAAGPARAGYDYTSTPGPATLPFGGGSVALLGPESSSSTLSGRSIIDVAKVGLTSTSLPSATDTVTIPVTVPIAITNSPSPDGPGVGTITLTGTLSFQRSDTGGEMSTFTNAAFSGNGASIGGVAYTLSLQGYTGPTVNSIPLGDGNISVVVTPSGVTDLDAVPEPASLVMLVSGLAGVAAVYLRRRRKA